LKDLLWFFSRVVIEPLTGFNAKLSSIYLFLHNMWRTARCWQFNRVFLANFFIHIKASEIIRLQNPDCRKANPQATFYGLIHIPYARKISVYKRKGFSRNGPLDSVYDKACVSFPVYCPGTTSTRGIICGGAKKWVIMSFSGRRMLRMLKMLRPEVLLANIVCLGQ